MLYIAPKMFHFDWACKKSTIGQPKNAMLDRLGKPSKAAVKSPMNRHFNGEMMGRLDPVNGGLNMGESFIDYEWVMSHAMFDDQRVGLIPQGVNLCPTLQGPSSG